MDELVELVDIFDRRGLGFGRAVAPLVAAGTESLRAAIGFLMHSRDVNEHQLVGLVASGDADAFAALFDQHGSALLGMLVQLLKRRELAEEILQETFMQAWAQADRYRPERATVRGWLLMLARSRALDLLRSRQARNRREERAATDATRPKAVEPVGTRNLESRERQGVVLRALAGLSENQRRCVELAFFEGLSHSRIAERLEQPLGTVKSRIVSGMRGLRRALETTDRP